MVGPSSRIPVLARPQGSEPSAESLTTSHAKRQCVSNTSEPEFSKVPSSDFASNVPADGAFKAANQGMPKCDKKVEAVSKKKATKCFVSRYQLETELKKKNQLVQTLKQQLARAEEIKEIKKENERLVQEGDKIKKVHETCICERCRISEGMNMDPVSTNLKENNTQELQEQAIMLTEKVLEELVLFFHTVAKEKEMLEAMMANWKSAQEEKLHTPD